MQRYKLGERERERKREIEVNHAEAIQNEKMLVGVFAYKAAGKRSGSDLILVLRWCCPIVLLWIYSNLREKRISRKADTCSTGDRLSCLAVWQKDVCVSSNLLQSYGAVNVRVALRLQTRSCCALDFL